jgi:hypothetical protein
MSTYNGVTPATPAEKLSQLTSNIHQLLQDLNESNTSQESVNQTLHRERLSDIMRYFQQQQTVIQDVLGNSSPKSASSSPRRQLPAITPTPEYYTNAKYEDLACKPIKPLYDGSPEQLVPFLNRLDIRRQDEGWYPITFLLIENNNLDLTRHFAKLDETVMIREAQQRWLSPTVNRDKHMVDHPTYNARVLGRLLLRSITDDFSTTVINRIPQEFRNDGPLILWTICNNIHRNNVAFVETIKSKIRTAKLSHFSDDACKYIVHIKDNLRLITAATDNSNEHNDLIIHLLTQLSTSPIKPFREAMERLHVNYLEAKLPDLTPTKLLKLADDKTQILKHAGQWKDTETPAVMALKLALEQQKSESDKMVKQLVAHIGKMTNQRSYQRSSHDSNLNQQDTNKRTFDRFDNNNRYPSWMVTAPADITETKVVDRRLYSWCSKCRQGQGLWVNHHNTATHVNGYRGQRRRLETTRRAHLTATDLHQQDNPIETKQGNEMSSQITENFQIGTNPIAQMSMLDYLNSYLPDHDNEVPDNTGDPE